MGRITIFDLLLTWCGRVNRAKFYVGLIALYILHALGYGVAMLLNNTMGWDLGTEELLRVSFAWSSVVLFWPTFALYAKRVHDLGRNAFFGLLALTGDIVFILDQLVFQMGLNNQGWIWIGSAMVIYLLFAQSDKGKNLYGDDPVNNRLAMLVKLSAF